MTIRPLQPDDLPALADFLARQPSSYREHFHPFEDESAEGLARVIREDSRDRFWGVFDSAQDAEEEQEWLAFFQLRGWEEGYERPSFGLLVDHGSQGRGLGQLCLETALTWCRLRGVSSCMLKVSANNSDASRLYERAGFREESICPDTGHRVMSIDL